MIMAPSTLKTEPLNRYRVYGIITGNTFLGVVEAPDAKTAENLGWNLRSPIAMCRRCAMHFEELEVSRTMVEIDE